MAKEPAPWTLRLRFKTSRHLASDEARRPFQVGDREGELVAEGPSFKVAPFLIMLFPDFDTEEHAHIFAMKLKRALLVAAVKGDMGVDLGSDHASFRSHMTPDEEIEFFGRVSRPSVHGIQIYQPRPGEVFTSIDALGETRTPPQKVMDAISRTFDRNIELDSDVMSAVELIASSKTATEALSSAVLAVAAVELLSQGPAWNAGQRELLRRLQRQARTDTSIPEQEAAEVANAMQSIFRGIGQAIRRNMQSLGMTAEDQAEFSAVYQLRSDVFHGGRPDRSRAEELRTRAEAICRKVVLAAIDRSPSAN